MTKLKNKKSKKRAKTTYRIEELTRAAVYAEFCQEIAKESSKGWIPADFYQWACASEDFTNAKTLADLQSRKSCPSVLHQYKNAAEFFGHPTEQESIELLLAVLAFSRFAEDCSADQVSEFLRSIVESISHDSGDLNVSDPVSYQILFGEIPLTIGLLAPGLIDADALVASGIEVCNAGIEELLDGNGIPASQYLSHSGMLLASWTRCTTMCDLKNRECLDVDAQTQYEYFVRQMIRLVRKDGTLAFSQNGVDLRPVIRQALDVYHDEDDANIAMVAFPKIRRGGMVGDKRSSSSKKSAAKKTKTPSLNALPEASSESEWAEVAIMQMEWLPKSPKLIVDFRDRKVRIELSVGQVILSGGMEHQFLVDDQLVSPASDWEVVCWHSDQDGDFLELECELDNGAKWQKQFLLARNENFLLTGDILLNAGGDRIRVEGSLPLGNETGFGLAKETREVFMTRKAKTVASILPIAVSEWRVDRAQTELSIENSAVSYQLEGVGENIYCPLFIDLDPKRCRKPLTWRQLTVAEQLEIVPTSQAAAFRVQVGGQQWLIYRSLVPPQNRTFLGQNLSMEFYVGTFDSDGTCSEIISVNE